eukprot:12181543-Prorocentrum_lima.AAC.1
MSERYGLSLNKLKCELLRLGGALEPVHFVDGSAVPVVDEAKYLGCVLNDRTDPRRELRIRMSLCITVWKKLDTFWLHSDCPVPFKLLVYDAVVRSKLLYGLESLQFTQCQMQMLDTFQLKGLRKILRMKTTFCDRSNTNDAVFQRANAAVRHGTSNPSKVVLPLSKVYLNRKIALISEILTNGSTDPRYHLNFDDSLLMVRPDFKKR